MMAPMMGVVYDQKELTIGVIGIGTIAKEYGRTYR
jgi:hypothetical protein